MAGTRTTPPPIPSRPTRLPAQKPIISTTIVMYVSEALSIEILAYRSESAKRFGASHVIFLFWINLVVPAWSNSPEGACAYLMAIDRKPEFFKGAQLKVAIIGCGYVGLPLALRFAEAGHKVTGFDTDPHKVSMLNAGRSYIEHIPQTKVQQFVNSRHFGATTDFARLKEADAIIICVPTPLDERREPDLSYVEQTAISIYPHLQKGQLVSLESTTYPGTTEELVLPILEKSGLRCPIGAGPEAHNDSGDFFLAFSPEREDPGNKQYGLAQIPKVVGGLNPTSGRAAQALYG